MVESGAFRSVEPIAIIGMAGRFPGAGDVRAFWKNVLDGVDATRQLDRGELLAAGVDAQIVDDPNYVPVAGVLDDIDLFDADFFRIPPSDADVMDPQQRLALECAWQAFEDAGYAPGATEGSVGVFIGASLSTYLLRNLVRRPDVVAQAGVTRVLLGNDKDHAATMISHYLRLRGPSIAVGSACSSSLSAVAMACQSLWTYQSDMALAGGVGVQVPQPQGHIWQNGGIYSRDGRCRAFDEDAGGTVGGSGIGIILLKRLDEATADGDHIYALIRGAAINNDGGGKVAYSAPSAAGQAAVISEALMLAGIEPGSIGYVEAHGTGTSLGDAVEIAALSDVFAGCGKDLGGCALGSVKTAIGHLDAAAGVASLIKAVLAVKQGQIPASLHFEKPNSQLDLRRTPFYVPRTKTPWPKALSPRRAGVSSFGIGGTNAHIVVEEPPALPPPVANESTWWILPLSAKSEAALRHYAAALAAYLAEHPHLPIADVSFTLAAGRHAFDRRVAVVCREIGSAVRELGAIADGAADVRVGDAAAAGRVERQECERLAKAWSAGEAVDWTSHYAGKGRRRVPLPSYPFERRRFWIAPSESTSTAKLAAVGAPRLPRLADLLPWLRERQKALAHELAIRPIASFPGLKRSLDSLCASHAYWFLRAHGLPAEGEPPIRRVALQATLSAQPTMHRLLDYLLHILAQDGLIVATELGIQAGPARVPPHPASIAQQIKQHYPGFTGLLDLIAHCVGGYARTFAAPVSGVEVLYPGGAADLLQRTLGEGTVEHTQTRLALRLVRDLIDDIAEHADQPLRILEVGAGGGGLTAELAPALAGRKANYHVSDISPVFVGALEAEARRRNFRFMTFGTLDITRAGASQGYAPASYDVILALNTVHATPSIPESLANLNALLAPGGILALIETVRPERWLNLIWGVSEGWWSYADGLRDLGPLIDDAQWIEALRAQKLADVASLPDDAAIAEPDVKLFVACRALAKAVVAGATPIPAKQPKISDWFSVPSWERAPEPAELAAARRNENWLVFSDAAGVCNVLAEELKRQGHRVTVVLPGSRFAREKADLYRIHPDRQGDYLDLLLDLANGDRTPARVVYGWPITAGATGGNGADDGGRVPDYGFYGVLEFVKALAGQGVDADFDLVVLSNGMHDVIGDEPLFPFNSVLLGAVKIIPREYPNVSCCSIDIQLAVGDALDAQTVRRLVQEMYRRPVNPVLALRGRHAWQPVIRPMPLQAGARSEYLRPGGVFLVVGGLGGVGLSLAEVLAESPGAKIVLVARSAFPAPGSWDAYLAAAKADDPVAAKLARLKAMQAAGAEVTVRSADVCDVAAMRALVLWMRQHYGALDGVIHAAGSPDIGGIIQRRSREATRSALAAKIEGIRALDRVFEGTWPELTVLCSSIGSILYNLKFGEVGYVAANDFMNAFAHYAARTHRGRFVTIDWTDWQEDGMWAQARARLDDKYALLPSDKSQATASHTALVAGDLLGSLSTSEAKEAFRRILACAAPQVIVSTQRIDELLSRHSEFTTAHHNEFLETMGFVRKRQARPQLRTPFVPPRTATERQLAEIWQKLLGIERIGIDDDYFELGGDSLLAIRILNSLNDEFGMADTLTGLLSVPTIARLADRIDSFGAHADRADGGPGPNLRSAETMP
jgi:3-oxoacyl-(acyl-carrier-protein) synthase/NAD(P)-dependent dehydrogenase (short-subunit alcohol dehydrogenase family)/SAM-dependent methyltransferase/acyl carrier protein